MMMIGSVILCISIIFFFSSRRRHTRFLPVSWARRCVQETETSVSDQKILEKATEIFGAYDLNRNDVIEEDELRNLVSDLSVVLRLPEPDAKDIQEVLKIFDTNQDGVLNQQEFIKFVRKVFYNR
eukprot:TRINITY_DN1459_c0_g1_i14.p3 TRINITY_DN1459_c0_g1~~TRINITY_DN1459_c0_g1_i14.p3  ORF type:complete len:125 (-),score=43.53 TRINITY_DN1459_c0_g1_i14:126-500(-)